MINASFLKLKMTETVYKTGHAALETNHEEVVLMRCFLKKLLSKFQETPGKRSVVKFHFSHDQRRYEDPL